MLAAARRCDKHAQRGRYDQSDAMRPGPTAAVRNRRTRYHRRLSRRMRGLSEERQKQVGQGDQGKGDTRRLTAQIQDAAKPRYINPAPRAFPPAASNRLNIDT